MRLAFYTCLALAIALFWGWIGFMLLYFIHLDHPAYHGRGAEAVHGCCGCCL